MGGSSTDAQLLRLAQRLAAARDAPEVATIVARDVATLVGASAASVGLVDAQAGVLRVHHGPDVGPEMLERYANPPLDAPLLFTDVARTGVASCLPDFEAYRARYPDTDRANEQLGVGARAAVPLRDRGGVAFGAVVFAWEHPVDFDGSVGAALATIGDLVSQTLDRARLADAEHQLVDTFRRRLLSPIPATTGIASAGAYRPAAAEIGMGGDWYEGIALPGGRLAVVVGDVAGHGIEAVADMAHLRSILAAFLRIGLPLPRLVRRVTQAIGDAALTASLFVAVVDPTHRTIEYLLVGHPPPVLLLADTARLVSEPLHPLLGAPVGVEVGTGTIAFPVGATLLAYTDGLVERRGESLQVGLDALVRIASRFTAEPDLRTFLSRVLDALLGDTPPDDDVALVALRSIDAPPAAVGVKVRFAVSPGLGPPEPERLAEMADGAEDLGFDAIWLSDLPTLPGIDPFLAAAYVASRTTRLKIGTNLVPFGYEPFVFARQLAQLDRLAAGRLLVTLVPGLDAPGERAALGIAGAHRGRLLDERMPILRDLLAGGDVPGGDDGPVALPVLPVQQPLELWLGGSGPQAVVRAGRLADGWLGSLMPPTRAAAIRGGIADAAAAAGRTVDPEHFGLSIAYARHADPASGPVPLTARAARARIEPAEPIPVGRDALRSLVARLVDVGMSKFVVRPATTVTGWRDELAWLADAVLDLQT